MYSAHRSTLRALFAATTLIALALIAMASSQRVEAASLPGGAAVVPGEVVVRFAPVAAPQRARALAAVEARGGESLAGVPGTRTVELPAGTSVAAGVRELGDQPGVLWAEPNYRFSLAALPDDPLLDSLWGLRNFGQTVAGQAGVPGIDVSAESAWNVSTGSGAIRVAVVDSGIDPTHPDLVANLNAAASRNFVLNRLGGEEPGAWQDYNQHGTHVAGTIGAVGNNGIGVAGVAWDADLVSTKVCATNGSCTTAATAEGLAYAGAIGARVANASLGTPHSFAMRTAIAANPGTLYVVAAGNESVDVDQTPTYPCAFELENIVCVAAIDSVGALAGFSNTGATAVDVGAPGVDIRSTVPELVTVLDGDAALAPWAVDPAGSWFYDPGSEEIELDGSSPPLAESTLTLTDPLDFGALQGCRIGYQLALDTTEDEQPLYVEASSSGGAWIPVQGQAGGYSGSTGGEFIALEEDLSAFDGEPSVRVRFRFAPTVVGQSEPAVVSLYQPSVTCVGEQPPGGAYAFLSGTSMASPHVAGVAALAWSVHPGASVAEMRRALLESALPTPSLAGVTATGGRVDAAAALAALARPVPAPISPAPAAIRTGWAIGVPAGQRLAVSSNGRTRVKVRCRAAVVERCAGRLVLRARVRGLQGLSRRPLVLAARGYRVARGEAARLALWLRPRPARLLREGRLGAAQLLVKTRQPRGAERQLRVQLRRVGLRSKRSGRG